MLMSSDRRTQANEHLLQGLPKGANILVKPTDAIEGRRKQVEVKAVILLRPTIVFALLDCYGATARWLPAAPKPLVPPI
ncbi:hypothetical protein M514_22486 [Trichuris suis]|uniref:Uncharacterized protein n=1 Tax=Trichuris suis TaxID=68888 RepID=A0A085N780_9BILA|nr:hypothetical protein M514_22486 [Trichuris suis]